MTAEENNPSSVDYAMDRLAAETKRVNEFMTHIRWMVSIVSSLVLVTVGLLTFLGVSNLNDIRSEISEETSRRVKFAILREEDNLQTLESLNERFASTREDFEKYRETINALSLLGSLESVELSDVEFLYESLTALDTDETNAATRATALELVRNIVKIGVNNQADPNVLFNSAVEAQRRGFQYEALQLATLARIARPSNSHRILASEMEESLGQQFTLNNGELVRSDTPPNEVRNQAWIQMLDLVSESPTAEGEQVYSRAQNTALRNGSAGFYRELIEAIQGSSTDSTISYAFVTLANLFALESGKDWEQRYWAAVFKALERMKLESQLASWYSHSAKDLLRFSTVLDNRERLLSEASGAGLDLVEAASVQANLYSGLGDVTPSTSDALQNCPEEDVIEQLTEGQLREGVRRSLGNESPILFGFEVARDDEYTIFARPNGPSVDPAIVLIEVGADDACEIVAINDDDESGGLGSRIQQKLAMGRGYIVAASNIGEPGPVTILIE